MKVSAPLARRASPEATKWLERLSTLRVDPVSGIAPYKPLLLLVVCDLAEEGKLTGAILHCDGDLAFRFSSYWTIVANRRRTKPDLRLPFYHLQTSDIWQPLDLSGNPATSREVAVLAQLDISFLLCLNDSAFRTLARRTLIAKYFEPHERAELYDLCELEKPPQDIIASDATRFVPPEDSKRKRDAKFSVRVLPAYEYTCALTRYRMIAVNGTTALDAAHIHQFKQGGECHPTNGLALSKTAHWLFDRGYWSISDDYRILVAEKRFDESGEEGHLLKRRSGTLLLLPKQHHFWPEIQCLQWHRTRHGFESCTG